MLFFASESPLSVTIILLWLFQINEQVLPLLTDEELEQYIPLRGQRVLARNFCTNSSSNTLAKAPNLVENLQEDTPSPLPSLCNDNLQRKADAIAKVREKLSAGSKKTGKKSSELGSKHKNIRKERTVEIGWSHFNSRERRYAQVRQPCGGGTRHPKMLKSSTKTDILKEAVEPFKPLVSETDMDLDISFDVSGQMIMGNDETIGELYEKTKLRYLRFYLISKYKNDSDYDSSLPDIPVINLPGALIAADISSAVTIPVDMGTPSVQCRVASDHILTLSDAFLELEKLTKLKRGDRVNIVNVTRDNVMDGGFRAFRRKHFDPNDRLHVKFAGEQGIDEGGPSREFLELMFVAIRKRYFYGEDQNMHLRLDATGGYYRKKKQSVVGSPN